MRWKECLVASNLCSAVMVLLARSQQDHLAGASVAIGLSLLAWVVTVFALLVIHEQTLLANSYNEAIWVFKCPQISEGDTSCSLMCQPEMQPISQDQLVAEVKGIYAGLVMVAKKCIEVDNAQSDANPDTTNPNYEQFQAIALHRTHPHEHHDFFPTSQQPSPSTSLRRLAAKYAMPARMWTHVHLMPVFISKILDGTISNHDIIPRAQFSLNLAIVMLKSFPSPEQDEVPTPLPEDNTMRGLIHQEDYNPEKLLADGKSDEDEKYFEHTPMVGERKERMLYLDYNFAPQDQWLTCAPAHVLFPWMNQML
ncbi:hypothetical protein BKA56DRAFT_659868 [Ilyonectria sp. MPI-CAGE-AT-0026]|nr:hypothetical protein BKA56DRAFT_659868 [Ilyonectria sp. MPI-CAGE-AT-0026]